MGGQQRGGGEAPRFIALDAPHHQHGAWAFAQADYGKVQRKALLRQSRARKTEKGAAQEQARKARACQESALAAEEVQEKLCICLHSAVGLSAGQWNSAFITTAFGRKRQDTGTLRAI